MSDNFPAFTKMVTASFQDLVKGPIPAFVVDIAADTLWAEYLAAFPSGSDPLFKTSTEHDCRCCKHFIRRVGAVVAVGEGGELRTVWDRAAMKAGEPYRAVAARLRDVVRVGGIHNLFCVSDEETSFGAAQSHSLDKATGKAFVWNHLHTGEIPRGLRVASPDQVRGDCRTTVAVFERGLVELTASAVETVLSLIEGNALYRGEEHKSAVLGFLKMQREFLAKPEGRARETFAWANAGSPAARFRNTVIGTLVQDLSEGQDVERAVKSFETKVAPQNYKRTTALITPGMVKKAMETIEALGLESALERRFAVIESLAEMAADGAEGEETPATQDALRVEWDGVQRLDDKASDKVRELGAEIALRAAYLAYRRWKPDGDGETFLAYVTREVRAGDLTRASLALDETSRTPAPWPEATACASCGLPGSSTSTIPEGGVALHWRRQGTWVCVVCKDKF